MKFKERNDKHRFWMNLAFGYIVALFVSVVVLFFNLSSIYISVSCFTICFITVIGAKICFAKADQYEKMNVAIPNQMKRDIEEVAPVESIDAKQKMDSPSEPQTEDVNFIEPVAEIEVEQSKDIELTEIAEEVAIATEESDALEVVEEMVEASHKEVESTEVIPSQGSELDSFEQEIFEQIQAILTQHERDAAKLKTKKVGTYFDVIANATVLRFKLKGRKQYVLTHLDESVVKDKGLTMEAPSKNERFNSRVILTSSDVLNELSDYIIENFDKAC